jgi:protein-disulfide isomerase
MDKRFIAILAGIVIILGGIFIFTKSSNDNNGGGGGGSGQPTNHVRGEGQSGVTLLEYGDFQCPVCQIYFQPMEEVAAKYQQQIFFQFRHLPLTSIHQNAFAAARAAEAADKQGKFWEMYAQLYQNQGSWSNASNALERFKSYAQAIGLDVAKFEADYASEEINDAINADVDEFEKTGQPQSTPTFFIDGKVVENNELVDSATGSPSVEKISALIDKAIAEKSGQ